MSLKTDQIKNELIRYLSVNPTLFSGMVLSSEVYINQFARTVTKVKGHYPLKVWQSLRFLLPMLAG